MSPETIMQLATPVAMVVLLVMQNRSAAKAAEKVAEVKTALAHSGGEQVAKLTEIHALVNSEMTKALEKIDKLQKQIARLRLAARNRK